MISRGRLLVPPILLLFGALAGCGSTPERAVTVGVTSPAAGSIETTPAAPKPKGAGDALDAKQVKAAVLTVADMPTGWAVTESKPDTEDHSTVEPASCQKLFDEMDNSKKDVKAKHTAKASFEQGGMLGVQFENEVASFSEDHQGDKVQAVADLLTACPKITLIDGSERTPMTLSGLSFPNLGDQTLAFRAKAKSEGVEVVLDAVFVAVGHNVVSFTAAGLQPMPGADLETVARTGMRRVAAAAKS